MERDRPEVPDVTERIPNLIRRPFLDAAQGSGVQAVQPPPPGLPLAYQARLA
jgi:hypothetical protein